MNDTIFTKDRADQLKKDLPFVIADHYQYKDVCKAIDKYTN